MKSFFKIMATGLGVGYIPGAPGTYGTVIAAGLYLLIYSLPLYLYMPFCVVFVLLAIWTTAGALPLFKTKDPGPIVIDEIAGFLITMIALPFSWVNLGLGFIIFRVFDIIKPPPIRWIEKRLNGAWGVVLDDVAAGIYANVVLWVIVIFVLG